MQLTPKERDKEELVKDEKMNPDDPKSQIYKNPANILSVLAQRGGLQEIKQEDVNEIKKDIAEKLNGGGGRDSDSGIINRIATATKQMGRARTKLQECTPSESDYKAINDYLGGCTDIERVCRRGIMGALGQLERIGSTVANNSSDGRDSGMNRREQNMETYQRCLREAREMDRLVSGDSTLDRILSSRDGASRGSPNPRRDPLTQLNVEFSCYEQSRGGINQLFGRARPDYRGRHNEIMTNMDRLIGACETYRNDHVRAMGPVDDAERTLASAETNEITGCRNNAGLNTQLAELERDHDRVTAAFMGGLRAAVPATSAPPPRAPDGPGTAPIEERNALRRNFTRLLEVFFQRTKSDITRRVRGGEVLPEGREGFLRDFFANPGTYFGMMRTSLQPLSASDTVVLSERNTAAFTAFISESSSAVNNTELQAIINGYTEKANKLASDFKNCEVTVRSNSVARDNYRREVASGVLSEHDDPVRSACQAIITEANSLGERAASDRRRRSDGDTPIFDDREQAR